MAYGTARSVHTCADPLLRPAKMVTRSSGRQGLSRRADDDVEALLVSLGRPLSIPPLPPSAAVSVPLGRLHLRTTHVRGAHASVTKRVPFQNAPLVSLRLVSSAPSSSAYVMSISDFFFFFARANRFRYFKWMGEFSHFRRTRFLV